MNFLKIGEIIGRRRMDDEEIRCDSEGKAILRWKEWLIWWKCPFLLLPYREKDGGCCGGSARAVNHMLVSTIPLLFGEWFSRPSRV